MFNIITIVNALLCLTDRLNLIVVLYVEDKT